MITFSRAKTIAVIVCLLNVFVAVSQQTEPGPKRTVTTYQYLDKIMKDPSWQLTDSIALNFVTYHTQGLTKVGNFYYLSSVKIIRSTKKYELPQNGFDRDNGEGAGYIFKFGADGKLVDSVRVGIDSVYHPGGIDFDGKYIWVPVCEYRPFGKSVIYRINPENLEKQLVTTINDAIGAVAYNRETNELVGMNWGSRVFYRWKISQLANTVKAILQQPKGIVNPHYYVDYQDCNYVGNGKMFCSGLRSYKNAKGETIRLGGLELIDMKTYEATLQLPIELYTAKGAVITNNPFYINAVNNTLQFYFIPEDDKSALYIYHLK